MRKQNWAFFYHSVVRATKVVINHGDCRLWCHLIHVAAQGTALTLTLVLTVVLTLAITLTLTRPRPLRRGVLLALFSTSTILSHFQLPFTY